MGCCFGKKNKDDADSLLKKKGSIDYDTVTTNISWNAVQNNSKKKKKKHLIKPGSLTTHYVAIDDDEDVDAVPNLNKIDNFSQNMKNRSRQSSAHSSSIQQNINNLSFNTSLNSLNQSIKSSSSPADNNINDENIRKWRPFLIKTYKINLKSPLKFDNAELLSLLEVYKLYFAKNNYNKYMINDDDEKKLEPDINSSATATPFGAPKDNNVELRHNHQNLSAYKSFLNLYNFYNIDGKKGGIKRKLELIEEFIINNNLFYLPAKLIKNLGEYYKKNGNIFNMNKTKGGNDDDNDDNDDNENEYYLRQVSSIINIIASSLNNVSYFEVNGIKLYYKIYYPLNNDLYSNRIPLILISDYGMLKEDWYKLPYLLSYNRIVITFDMRGIGQTGANSSLKQQNASASLQNMYSINLLASDIVGLIEKIYPNNNKKVFILGSGYGGLIAQTLAYRFQYILNGLILINSYCGGKNDPIHYNLYAKKYLKQFINNKSFKNDIKKSNNNNNNCFCVPCIESISVLNDDVNKVLDDNKEGSIDINNDNDMYFYRDYNDNDNNDKYSTYSYIMETTFNNRLCPFIINTISGNIPSSLLNRSMEGILPLIEGYISSINCESNISHIHNICNVSVLVLYGENDYIIPPLASKYLESVLIGCKNKEIYSINNCGHLWWLTNLNESVKLINNFLFKTERSLLNRYDIIINNISNLNNLREFTIQIKSISFISDCNNEYQEKYLISSSDILLSNNYPYKCKFLCLTHDIGKQLFIIEILTKTQQIIGKGTCTLTETQNAQLILDITNVSSPDINDNNILMKFNIKHGSNKSEHQQNLSNIAPDLLFKTTPNGPNNINNNNNDNDNNDAYDYNLLQPQDGAMRLDSDDLDGLDL